MTIKHLFPDARPTLNLDFANELALDPRITFTRSSTGTYFDKNGIIQYAADDEPRFDYDGLTCESLGLLIEESRTNLFDESENLQNWISNFYIKTNNVAISPDGTQNAASLVPNVGTSSQSCGRTVTQSAGVHTCSVFAKPNGLTNMKIRFSGSSYQAVFELIGDGTIIQENNGTASILKYTNGWYKCTFTLNDTVGATAKWEIGHSDSANVDGINGFYIWGMQVEAGNFPTSYIPTAGTTETRAADFANITGTNFSSWYNQGEGSFIVSTDRVDGLPASQFTVTTTNVRLPEFKFTTSGAGQIFNNTTGAYQSPTPLLKATFGASFDGTGMSRYINGSGDSVENANINDTNTAFYLGNYLNNATLYILTGHISRLSYYPRRLSDEQLQALTA